MIVSGLIVVLLVLSFLPVFAKSLSLGGEIQINFWQKYFMKID